MDARDRTGTQTASRDWDRDALSTTKLRERDELRAELQRERRAHAETLRLFRAESRRRRNAETAGAQALHTLQIRDTSSREAHHRVKNTLQIVSSLLSLQANATDQTEVRRALQEASARLHLLSHAHDCLDSAASNAGEVSASRLIRIIVDALPRSFSETCSKVRLHVKVTEISMPAEEAIAVALIANELVTNAYKHAFPEDRPGLVTVELYLDGSGSRVVLRISDTGVGHSAGMSGRGFGASIVRTFAEQLGGTLTLLASAGGRGTIATLSVPRSSRAQDTSSHVSDDSQASDEASPPRPTRELDRACQLQLNER